MEEKLIQKEIETRYASLLKQWSLADTEALLTLSPTVHHVDVCVQSLLIQCLQDSNEELDAEDYLAYPMGCIASWSSMETLNTVLTQHVPWLRILELCWMHMPRTESLMYLVLCEPLSDHPLAQAIMSAQVSDTPDLSEPHAAATLTWFFELTDLGDIQLPYMPPKDTTTMHPSVRKHLVDSYD